MKPVNIGGHSAFQNRVLRRKNLTCNCLEKGIRDCKCNRIYHQPDCDIGWDSHRNRFYFGYDLYMLTASDSENDLPVFPFLSPAMLEQDKMLVLLEKLQSYGFSVEIDDFGSGYSSLNMAVITEGVETETQLAYLLTIGCNMFQGYYFDKPISVKEFEENYL